MVSFSILGRIILMILYILCVILVARYFLHMLQLSSYQFQGYFRFLNNEAASWLPLIFSLVPLAAFFLKFSLLGFILTSIYLAGMMFLYRPKKAKKAFVVTARVKRLIVTLAILWLIICLAALVFAPSGGYVPHTILCIAFVAQPLLVALANFINKPVEKAVQQHFIDEAVSILEARPDLKIIGVTGSFGKTSVKYALQTLLSEGYRTLMTPASFNTPMGVVKTIREDLQPTHQVFICEMGARHVGDIKEICDIVHPQHGVITSIGYQHLETFHTLDNIIGTKYELLDEVENNGRHGMKFVNGDNTVIREHMKYPDAITYGLDEENDFHGKILEVTRKGTVFTVTTPEGEEETFRMSLIGRHNVVNIIGCIAVAHKMGIPLKKLRLAVAKLEGVPHRLQLISRGPVTIIDDAYNSNPEGTKAALETLSLFEEVKILVTPGMVELGQIQDEANREFGRGAAAVCDYIILVGAENTRSIRTGVLEAGFPKERLLEVQSIQEASKLMYEIESSREKVILLENDLPDNYK